MLKKASCSIAVFIAVFFVISIAADVVYVGRNADRSGWTGQTDFKVFYTASRNLAGMISGSSENRAVYDKTESFYHFRYSPFIALLFVPFTIFAKELTSLYLWSFFTNALFLAALILIAHNIRKDFKTGEAGYFLPIWAAFLGTLRYYLMVIGQGQTDVITAFLLVVFLYAYINDKEAACGTILGFIIHFKPLFLPVIIYFLLRGKKKLAIASAVSFLAFLCVPAFFVGVDGAASLTREWFGMMSMSIPSQLLNFKNQSIAYGITVLLMKSGAVNAAGAGSVVYSLSALLFSVSYAFLFLFARARRNSFGYKEKYMEVSLVFLPVLLFSPIAWEAFYTILIIPIAFAAYLAMACVKHKTLYVLAALYALFSCAWGTDITKYVPMINNLRFINISMGTLCLAGILIHCYRRS